MAGGPQAFVGRERELERLTAAFDDARAGRGALVLVAGPPGVGKSTLAEALCERARAAGALAVWGRCWENGGAPAYWPWVQALRAYAREREPDELRTDAGTGLAYLTRLLPELAAPGAGAEPEAAGEQARFALFQAVSDFLRAASSERPLLLVLDDLHAADPSSLLMLRFVSQELAGTHVLILGMYRDVEAHLDAETGALLADVERQADTLALGGLRDQEIESMVAARLRAPAARELVASLQDVTGGNPFFVSELLRLLEAQGGLELVLRRDAPPLPAGVRETIGRRLAYLPTETRALLRAAAVVGREFALPLLAELARVPPAGALAALEDALHFGLVEERDPVGGRFRFAHGLIRETLYEEIPRAERAALHRRAGEALETLRAADLEPHLAELAHHFLQAADPRGVDYAARAGARAHALLAHEDAARHFEEAIAALELVGQAGPEQRCNLLLALGDARWCAAQTDAARSTFLEAGALARELADPDRLARAALGFGGRFAWVEATGVVDTELVELLEAAIAAQPPGDSAVLAELMARLAMLLYFDPGEQERRDELSSGAVAMARRLGEPGALGYALNARRFTLWHASHLTERLAVAEELVEVARAAREPELLLRGQSWRIGDLLEQGDMAAADLAAEEHGRLAAELRQPLFQAELVKWRATRALLAGRMEDAERLLGELAAAADRIRQPDMVQAYGVHLFVMRGLQGRLDEIAPLVEGFVEQFPEIESWRAALAFLYTELRRDDDARDLFERLAAGGFALDRQAGSWAIGFAMLAEVCAYLGDGERAALLYERLVPYERLAVVIGYASACFGAAGRSLGILAHTMGRPDLAERHFRDAIELNERMGARAWLAWSKADYARLLANRGAPGDPAEVERLLGEVIRSAELTGAARIAEKAAEVGWEAGLAGVVTLLFSDIEESTSTARALGDRAWLELLRRHNAVVRAQLSAHGGFEVKTQGDGFMVAFPSERRAVDCAIAIQRALGQSPLDAGGRPLRVRIGLHTGEALRDAGDFYGTNVNLAARVAAAAGPGEVLVSGHVKERLGREPYQFGEPRSEQLKGLPGEHELYSVRWDAG